MSFFALLHMKNLKPGCNSLRHYGTLSRAITLHIDLCATAQGTLHADSFPPSVFSCERLVISRSCRSTLCQLTAAIEITHTHTHKGRKAFKQEEFNVSKITSGTVQNRLDCKQRRSELNQTELTWKWNRKNEIGKWMNSCCSGTEGNETNTWNRTLRVRR